MSVVVVAIINPIPEHRAEVITAYERVIARAHLEDDGCELYALHEGDDRLVLIEKWPTADALEAHRRGPAVQECRTALTGKLVAPSEVRVLTPHPAGTVAQGIL